MKKIRIINNQKVAYIEKMDIDTLHASRDFVRPEIFNEPDIINMECDTEGFYRIGDPKNAEYIESLAYIPDFDYLASLSKDEINKLADKALCDKNKISEIIIRLCEYKKRLKHHEKMVLKKADYLDQHCASQIEQNVLNASSEGAMFRSMETTLLAQARNYALAIIRMAEQQPTLPSNGTKIKKILKPLN